MGEKDLRIKGHINYGGEYIPVQIEIRAEAEHISDIEKIVKKGFLGYPLYTGLSNVKCGICHRNMRERGASDPCGGRTILFCWNPKCKQYDKYYSEKMMECC